MSANDWNFCPKCKVNFDNKLQQLSIELEDLYGKVPREQYMEVFENTEVERASIKKLITNEDYKTLRLDYTVSVNEDGEFKITFTAVCDRCGLIHKHNHKEQINLTTQNKASK